MEEQKAFSFDAITITKIGKGALIAGGGAFIVYALNALGELSFGVYTPIVTACVSILINVIREYINGKIVK